MNYGLEIAADITNHSGSKYLREIRAADSSQLSIKIDVYAVLVAFNVTCPATAHAVKKLLCAGLRGKGDKKQDLQEAIYSLYRAVEMCKSEASVAPQPTADGK